MDAYDPWKGGCGTGMGNDTFTSGFEGPWTTNPTQWDNEFFKVLVDSDWEKHVGPGGHWQWRTADRSSPYADVMRLTSDVALMHDAAFAQAWNQLTTAGAVFSKAKKCMVSNTVVV